MKIKLHEIPVREVVDGCLDSAENGEKLPDALRGLQPEKSNA